MAGGPPSPWRRFPLPGTGQERVRPEVCETPLYHLNRDYEKPGRRPGDGFPRASARFPSVQVLSTARSRCAFAPGCVPLDVAFLPGYVHLASASLPATDPPAGASARDSARFQSVTAEHRSASAPVSARFQSATAEHRSATVLVSARFQSASAPVSARFQSVTAEHRSATVLVSARFQSATAARQSASAL